MSPLALQIGKFHKFPLNEILGSLLERYPLEIRMIHQLVEFYLAIPPYNLAKTFSLMRSFTSQNIHQFVCLRNVAITEKVYVFDNLSTGSKDKAKKMIYHEVNTYMNAKSQFMTSPMYDLLYDSLDQDSRVDMWKDFSDGDTLIRELIVLLNLLKWYAENFEVTYNHITNLYEILCPPHVFESDNEFLVRLVSTYKQNPLKKLVKLPQQFVGKITVLIPSNQWYLFRLDWVSSDYMTIFKRHHKGCSYTNLTIISSGERFAYAVYLLKGDAYPILKCAESTLTLLGLPLYWVYPQPEATPKRHRHQLEKSRVRSSDEFDDDLDDDLDLENLDSYSQVQSSDPTSPISYKKTRKS